MSKPETLRFTCSVCGKEHDLDELSFGADAPGTWHLLNDDKRRQSELSTDQCVIVARGETSLYLRGCLDVPIRDTTKAFTWGVWCSLSEQSFLTVSQHWDDPRRTELPPVFGWLCTAIPTYPETIYLKTMVHQRAIELRPLVQLEPTDHPLAVHQREGIGANELKQMVTDIMHPRRS
jgi:hypothetical protein